MRSYLTRQRATMALGLTLLVTTLAAGQRSPGTVDLADFDTAPVLAYGQNASDQLRVSATGDFNGDGLDDVLLSSHLADFSDLQRVNVGAAYIIFGNADGFTLRDLGDAEKPGQDVLFLGADDEDRFGFSAASGDVNGDGVDDVIISAPGADDPSNTRNLAGEVYVFFGGPHLVSGTTRDIKGETGQGPDITIYGEERLNNFGAAVAVGRVDGGAPDLIITAPGASGPNEIRPSAGRAYVILDDQNLTTSGEVYVILGSPRFQLERARDLAGHVGRSADLTLFGAEADDEFGFSLAVSDLGGDGVPDLIIGAPLADGRDNERADAGEVYVFFGGRTLFNGVPRDAAGQVGSLPEITFIGPSAEFNFGATLAVAGQAGNQTVDLIVGAPLASGPEG